MKSGQAYLPRNPTVIYPGRIALMAMAVIALGLTVYKRIYIIAVTAVTLLFLLNTASDAASLSMPRPAPGPERPCRRRISSRLLRATAPIHKILRFWKVDTRSPVHKLLRFWNMDIHRKIRGHTHQITNTQNFLARDISRTEYRRIHSSVQWRQPSVCRLDLFCQAGCATFS